MSIERESKDLVILCINQLKPIAKELKQKIKHNQELSLGQHDFLTLFNFMEGELKQEPPKWNGID